MTATSLPPAPASSFASDNAAGAAPEVLAALVAANDGPALAYGDDPWTARAEAAFRDLFDAPVETYFCWGGTGANVVALGCALRPWQAVIATDQAHIVVDECGAPAHFTGATVAVVPHDDGKLRPESLAGHLQWRGSEHHPQPALVSVSQVTELGTVYTCDELAGLCEAAHGAGLQVHVDGARIANAVAATGEGVTTMLRDTGVDVVTFGLTKNGAVFGEAVVFLQPELAAHARFVRKQAGQLVSKGRFVAAQALALLEGDRWVALAAHANAMAQLLASAVDGIPGVEVTRPPEANSLFVRLPADRIKALQAWSFFWEWDLSDRLVRWMTSFATTPDDVAAFAAGVRALLA